jgi:hypothetical protein
MACPLCGSANQGKFTAEMIIHFSGIKNLDEPGVWAFPKLLVCLDCGFSRFNVSEPGLRLLAAGSPTRECSAVRDSQDDGGRATGLHLNRTLNL